MSNSFLFYCLLCSHSFQTNPNFNTNCFKLFSFYYNYTAPASLLGQASCNVDLVHGSLYFFTYKFKDTLQNQDANGNEYSEDGVIVTFDSQTFAPVLTAPTNMSRVLDGFDLTYELLEAAKSGTVVATFTVQPWSDVADAQSPHVVTFGGPRETAAVHTVPIDTLTSLATGNADVVSVTPVNQNLLNGAAYRLDLQYQDVAGNTASGLTGESFFIFDSATLAPILTSPASGASVGATITIAFTIPEEMKDETCMLIITETGGLDDPVPNPRMLTLGTAQHAAGSYSYTLTTAHIPQATFPEAWVSSVSSKFDLNDGTAYSFALSCADVAGNVATTVTNTNIFFAGGTTLAPILTYPAEDVEAGVAQDQCLSQFVTGTDASGISAYSTFRFTLSEPAQSNTVSKKRRAKCSL